MWIKDLFDFYHNPNNSIRSFIDRNDDDGEEDRRYKKQTSNSNSSTTILKSASATFHQDTTRTGTALSPSAVYNNNPNSYLYTNNMPSLNPDHNINAIHNTNVNTNPKLEMDSLDKIRIPFISNIILYRPN